MSNDKIFTGVVLDENIQLTFIEVCHYCEIPQDNLQQLLEHGLFDMSIETLNTVAFDYKMITRIQTANRLQHDLGVNLQGVLLALDLIDELNDIRAQIEMLKRSVEL